MAEESYSAELLPAERLLQALQGLTSMVKIYEANNQLVANNMEQFTSSAQVLLASNGSSVVHLENGRFFVNDEKLLRRKGVATVLDNLYTYLSDRRIPGFKIIPAIVTAPGEELVSFARFLNSCAFEDEPAEWLDKSLFESGITWISVIKVDENITKEEELPSEKTENQGRRYTRKIYAYTVRALQDVADSIAEGKRFGMRKASRMIQTMVEDICSPESRLMVMSTVRDYDDQIFIHSVNVAIMAIRLGRELGFSKEALEALGTSALFHDLGKLAIPPEELNKEGVISEADLACFQQHSLDSGRMILQFMVAPVIRKSRIMLSSFSHHLKVDLSGYPSIGWHKPQSLMTRIIAVVDVYDALTSARVYRRKPMSGDRALGLMRVGAGTAFDPLVLKSFIKMVGVYPVGTLLELEDGGLALVSNPPLADDLTRPRVLILTDDGLGSFNCSEEVDLAEMVDSGEYRHQIISSAHSSTRNIQPAALLL